VQRAWIRLTLSGSSAPPKVVGSEAEVLLYVAKNEGAIGFVSVNKVNDSVKVLAVQGKLPSEKGYLLKSVQ
jgi:stage V sporulation protein SpoVS